MSPTCPCLLMIFVLAFSFLANEEAMAAKPEHRVVTLTTLCFLDDKNAMNLDYVCNFLEKACERDKPDLVVTPFMPFLSFREGNEEADLRPFARLAEKFGTNLVVALVENRADGRKSYTSVLFNRHGKVVGKYRKTHAFPDDDGLALGDDLPVFQLDFAKVGLSITTDFYFPEVYWVERMKGAEINIWQDYPERLRDYSAYRALLKARCLDCHVHMITAMYADPRTYITNRYEMGMQGAAWGRSMILNRVGTPIADTGYEDGIATAVVDLDKRKVNVYQPYYEGENIFFCNCLGDRKAFRPLCDPHFRPAPRPAYKKRSARIAVGAFSPKDIWRDGIVPEAMLRVIDKAAEFKPDLLLLSEMAVKASDKTAQEVIQMIQERARRMNAYIVIGGVRDEKFVSIARVWDRSGREVFQEPIYWTKGFPEIKVFDTDFGRIGIHTCGDLYTGEIDRTLALMGAELILDPSQHWGADGRNNELMLRARAADNGCWVACAHWNTSDPGLRSVIIDPYGQVVAATKFQREDVVFVDVDFDDKRVYYAGQRPDQVKPGDKGIPSYFSGNLPEQRPGWKEMVFSRRRPELYGILPTVNDVIMKYQPKENPWK